MPKISYRVPNLIGICGNPKSGKSEVQNILRERYFVLPVDDGNCLRDFAQRHLGLTWEDTHTQDGKARYTEILGRVWQNREILGDMGKALEDLFGEHIMPFCATQNLVEGHSYSFGSVRKTQGRFFKERGGIILGIRNPLAPPSPYAFDVFDESLVDAWIDNDAQSRGLKREEGLADLAMKVELAIAPWKLPIIPFELQQAVREAAE